MFLAQQVVVFNTKRCSMRYLRMALVKQSSMSCSWNFSPPRFDHFLDATCPKHELRLHRDNPCRQYGTKPREDALFASERFIAGKKISNHGSLFTDVPCGAPFIWPAILISGPGQSH